MGKSFFYYISMISMSLFSFWVQGQNGICSHWKSHSFIQTKSNSLTVAQIQETEKYDVHFYALDIQMDNQSTDISGTGEIHGTARVTLDSVLFELFSTFNITDIRLNGVSVAYSRNNSAIKVPVNLQPGQSFEIAVDYNGTPPNAATNPLGGGGMSNGTSPTWGAQVTWSLSEPFSAYEWWPCKQSLKDKADSVSVKITVPSNLKAGSNGVLENVVDLGNGFFRYEWFHRHPIDYYLVSVSIADYQEYNVYANPSGAPGPVLIQNYIYDHPQLLGTFQSDIDETVNFIELFANLYGPYPFDDEKYGHCMAPFGGGMEHQTMTTQGWFEKHLTAHELAHQWWGDNVTCASWADIWVNEGFASYGEHLMLENLYPAETMSNMNDVHNNVMSQPGGSVWCEDSLNTSRIFNGRLTYDKGAAIIHTFRFIMNDDIKFFQALKAVQNIFADSTAHGVDIRDVFAQISGVNFDNAFNEWYFGEGYPIYDVKWNEVNGNLLLQIDQTTSSSTPLFTNDLELKFTRFNLPDTTIRVAINGNAVFYTIPNFGQVITLSQIDPNNWIINDASITHDTGLYVGINEVDQLNNITISPNPTMDGKITVAAEGDEELKIRVLDMTGRLILEKCFNKIVEVDLSKEKQGSYLIQISDSKAKIVRVIQKL